MQQNKSITRVSERMKYNITKNRLEKQQILKIVKSAFGKETEVDQCTELLDGFCNAAYRIRITDDREVVLKVAPKKEVTMMSCEQGMMQTEVNAMRLARQMGILGVPQVYFFEENAAISGSTCFLMECLEGQSCAIERQKMTKEEQQHIDHEIGAYLCRLHQIKGNRFGHFWMKELQWTDWFTAFYHLTENIIEDGRRVLINIGISYEKILDRLVQHREYFEEVKEPSLIHFDSWDGNIFVKNGHLHGMIDWERAMWADGLMEDRFRYHTRNTSFLEGYGIVEMIRAQNIRCAWYDVYLYLIMMFEGTYRHYETNDQYVWVHGLFYAMYVELSEAKPKRSRTLSFADVKTFLQNIFCGCQSILIDRIHQNGYISF